MRRRARRGWLALALLLTGFILVNVLAQRHARSMMQYVAGGLRTAAPERLSRAATLRTLLVGVTLPRPLSDQLPAALAPDCRELSIPGPGPVTLSAWSVDRGREAPLVILFHGYSAEKTSLLTEARILLELGASVLLVDFRGSGGSSESYTTLGVHEAEDVAAVVRYARARLPHGNLILFGHSMGAAAILCAVDRHGVKPDAVILEAVFDRMLHTVRNRFAAMHVPAFPGAELLVFWGGRQWGFNGFAHNPVAYARALTCPALFLHGADDPRATLAEGRRVYDAVPGAKRFREFKATGHESYAARHPQAWRAAVAEFMVPGG